MNRILLCEDDPAVAAIISRILVHATYDVVSVETAHNAVVELQRQVIPDLLITDLRLPTSMSGLDLARFAVALTPPVPVIVLTGYGTDAQVSKTDTLQDVLVLQKPVARLTLLAAVKAHLPQAPEP